MVQLTQHDFLSLSQTETSFEAAAMGRKEAGYEWKKNTDNIQEVFEFMEELGS